MFVPTLFGQAQPVDTGWNFAPIILIALAAYVWIYVARWRTSRAEGGARAAPYGRLALWLLGIALLFVALISPIDRLGEQFATFHMVQHLILADLVPICLTLALTKHILRPVTRRIHWLERRAGPFGHPAFGVIAYAAAMWIWHIPVHVRSRARTQLHPHARAPHVRRRGRSVLVAPALPHPLAGCDSADSAPCSTWRSTKIAVGFLGILLAFSPKLLYDIYGFEGTRWGLTALEDQQVAGVLMALEQSLVMGVALAYLFIRMLSEADEADEREERYGTV